MSKKFWLVLFLLSIGLIILVVVPKELPGLAVIVIAFVFLKAGCWGGKLEYWGKPKDNLPDGGSFMVFFQNKLPSGFTFLLKRLGRQSKRGFDYYVIDKKILDGQTKTQMEKVPERFMVGVQILEEETVYLIYPITT
jgi:hypothetical protein